MENIKPQFLYLERHTTQQVENIVDFFEPFLVLENFDLILEFGTSFGGLTYIIDDIKTKNNLNLSIHTFDYSYKDYVHNELNRRQVFYHILDETTEEFKIRVKELISTNKKKLFLCDGGNKTNEFIYYSNLMNSGDFIMAHDYAKDETFFKENILNKIWNWCEIKYSDIENSVVTNNLELYQKINFENAAWCCFVKK